MGYETALILHKKTDTTWNNDLNQEFNTFTAYFDYHYIGKVYFDQLPSDVIKKHQIYFSNQNDYGEIEVHSFLDLIKYLRKEKTNTYTDVREEWLNLDLEKVKRLLENLITFNYISKYDTIRFEVL